MNRSYLYYANLPNGQETLNQPLVIVLHQKGTDAKAAFSVVTGKLSKFACNLVFPDASCGQWDCNPDSVEKNMEFIRMIISDTYTDFQYDRNRVYLAGDSSSYCLVKELRYKFPDLIADSREVSSFPQDLPVSIKAMLSAKVKSEKQYELYSDITNLPDPDSIKKHSFYKRWVANFSVGGLYMFGSAKTDIRDGTNMDLSTGHSLKSLNISKWFSNNSAWFAEMSDLGIPREMRTVAQTTRVGGAFVFMLTMGLKQNILSNDIFHSYLTAGGGVAWIFAKGGKVAGLEKPKLNSDYRYPLQMSLGTGVDIRMTKRLVLGSNIRYIQSTKFTSLGNINAIQGLNVNFSVGYVINANSSKKPNTN